MPSLGFRPGTNVMILKTFLSKKVRKNGILITIIVYLHQFMPKNDYYIRFQESCQLFCA
jgi:hypothetical protein